ncbi:MAG TPA: hypothetical protein VFN61_16070 [Acidimicrobiales bacterium]|nr:hypothetical protein [Acidimicrobiales bacterium]
MTPEARPSRPEESGGHPSAPGTGGVARTDLIVATVFVATTVAAGSRLAGVPGCYLAATGLSLVGLMLIAILLLQARPPRRSTKPRRVRQDTTWAPAYWRLRTQLKDGTVSGTAYQYGLRPELEHLLAARLSERHGVNLYLDPLAAKDLFCSRRGDNRLWHWIAPDDTDAASRRGAIPRRVLKHLVSKLENL